MGLTIEQIENIQIDYGILYENYGEVSQKLLGPTRGGGEFAAEKTLRDIEVDGAKGKSKGLQVIDDMNAKLSVTLINTGMQTLARALPWCTLSGTGTEGDPYILKGNTTNIGAIPTSAYLKNVTMFAKTMAGTYKQITLYEVMNEGDLTISAKPKGEAEIALELYAHWDPTADDADLFEVKDCASISGDTTGPTITTDPADGDTGVEVDEALTVTFNEAINSGDIKSGNIVLMDPSDGSIVAGSLSYSAGTKTVTLTPTSNLDASTDYVLVVANVRDLNGNAMTATAVNFTTSA